MGTAGDLALLGSPYAVRLVPSPAAGSDGRIVPSDVWLCILPRFDEVSADSFAGRVFLVDGSGDIASVAWGVAAPGGEGDGDGGGVSVLRRANVYSVVL